MPKKAVKTAYGYWSSTILYSIEKNQGLYDDARR